MAKKKDKKGNKSDRSAKDLLRNSYIGFLVNILSRFQRFVFDIAGVLLLVLSLVTLMAWAFPDLADGAVITWWLNLITVWFGWGSVWIVVVSAIIGFLMLRWGVLGWPKVQWRRIFALELAAFTLLAILSVVGGMSLERADIGLDGGRVGWSLSYVLRIVFEPLGLNYTFLYILILSVLFLFVLIYGLGWFGPITRWLQKNIDLSSYLDENSVKSGSGVSVAPIAGHQASKKRIASGGRKRKRVPPKFRKKFKISADEKSREQDGAETKPPQRDERLPGLKILINQRAARPSERNINLKAGLIEKTLDEFGIPAKVIGFQVGPTVTQFAVEPGYIAKSNHDDENDKQKVRVSQITSLKRDMTLALSAKRLRVEAPVPGRPYIGIEVPNEKSTVVRLRPILEDEIFYSLNSPLAIALGRDVSGRPVVADLEGMPHLLIAGTTGSGKSVSIAALTTCLVMNNTPAELRLVMIDPKMVELVRFNGLPHLYGKVETDMERIFGVLRWTVSEMDRRYKLLEKTRSRNINTYNRKARRRKKMEPIPRILVMIDELADLMMSSPEQTETALVRLAQMARATGIHLVLATQRPSTDVVTGLIKANFPARISFAMASSVDSRVILDTTGAESLLGKGDLLFLPPEANAPKRAQGVMVSDQEVERVIEYWRELYPELAEEKPPWEDMLEKEEMLSAHDELIEPAIELVLKEDSASTSMLQRRLRVGYPRAARLMDQLEELGIVGPSKGGGRERDILFDGDDVSEVITNL